jgi:hypothetical protein
MGDEALVPQSRTAIGLLGAICRDEFGQIASDLSDRPAHLNGRFDIAAHRPDACMALTPNAAMGMQSALPLEA